MVTQSLLIFFEKGGSGFWSLGPLNRGRFAGEEAKKGERSGTSPTDARCSLETRVLRFRMRVWPISRHLLDCRCPPPLAICARYGARFRAIPDPGYSHSPGAGIARHDASWTPSR